MTRLWRRTRTRGAKAGLIGVAAILVAGLVNGGSHSFRGTQRGMPNSGFEESF
jgi:hypothetical protein